MLIQASNNVELSLHDLQQLNVFHYLYSYLLFSYGVVAYLYFAGGSIAYGTVDEKAAVLT